MRNSNFLLWAIFFTVSIQLGNCLMVHSPASIAGYILSPSIQYDVTDFSWNETQVVAADPFGGCSKIRNDLTGKIALVTDATSSFLSCSYETRVRNVKEAGAAGIIIIRTIYADGGLGGVAFFLTRVKFEKLNLYGVEIGVKDEFIDTVRKGEEPVIISLEKPDVNKFKEMTDTGAMIAYSVIFGLYALAGLLLSSWKLYGFIAVQGVNWKSPPQICLTIEIISFIFRVLNMVDPFFSTGVYPIEFTYFLISCTYPFTIATTLFIAFYWEQSLSSMTSAFGRTKWFFVVTSIVLCTYSSILTIVSTVNGDATTIGIFFLGIFFPIIPGLFLYNGLRVVRILWQNSSLRSRSFKGSPLLRITIYIVGGAVCLFIFLLAGFIWWLLYFGLYSVSWFHILAFQPPRKGSNNSSSNHDPLHRSQISHSDVTIHEANHNFQVSDAV